MILDIVEPFVVDVSKTVTSWDVEAHTIYRMLCGERSFGEGNNSLDPKSVEADKDMTNKSRK